MAELTLFRYRHQTSGLQVLDARLKLAAMAALSIATLHTGWCGMIVGSLLGMVIIWRSGVTARELMLELRYFLLFLTGIGLIHAWFAPGEPPGETVFFLSRDGLISGAMLSWRLLLIAIYGLGLTASTPSARIRTAVEWFLRPIPGVPYQAIGTMIGLLVRFIPVVLGLSRAIMDAQHARAVDNRKHPVYRIRKFSLPLLRRSMLTADRLACAMEARNYGPYRTIRPFTATTRDIRALVCAGVACILMITL